MSSSGLLFVVMITEAQLASSGSVLPSWSAATSMRHVSCGRNRRAGPSALPIVLAVRQLKRRAASTGFAVVLRMKISRPKDGAGWKSQSRIRIRQGKHGSAERPDGSFRVVAFLELGLGIVVEHFHDCGEASGLVEKDMEGIQGACVVFGGHLHASVGAREPCPSDKLADGESIHPARREDQVLDGDFSTCVEEGQPELKGVLAPIHEDQVVIRGGVGEPPNPFTASDILGLVLTRGVDMEGDGMANAHNHGDRV